MIPDTRHLCPSEARRALTDYMRARLASNPDYTYADLLGEMEAGIDGYAWSVLLECWQSTYNQPHAESPAAAEPVDAFADYSETEK